MKQFLESKKFWYGVLGFFALQATWLALTARYPMAFDENFHYGLIKLHAEQWLPWFAHQPSGAAEFGSVVRDPSYLYHFLLSLPYRLLSHLGDTTAILALRFLNIGFFLGGLVLMRRVLLRLHVSQAFTNVSLAMLTLIPVVPFLAATINYDNLFVPIFAAALLLSFTVFDEFARGKVPAAQLLVLLSLLLLGCLVKYPFLPVALVLGLSVLWRAWRTKMLHAKGWRKLSNNFMSLSRLSQIALAALIVTSIGLFFERYGMNLVHYHTPVPSCNIVLDNSSCGSYGPWARDNQLAAQKDPDWTGSILDFSWSWLYGMWYRLFFAISWDYKTQQPLPVISFGAVMLAALLVLGTFWRWRRLVASPAQKLIVILLLVYGGILFLDNLEAYFRTGWPVAINGRYWVPFLPLVFALGGLAWSGLLRSKAKEWAAVAVLVIFLVQGGGAGTFIIRNDNNWLWQNKAVVSANTAAKKIVSPLVICKGCSLLTSP